MNQPPATPTVLGIDPGIRCLGWAAVRTGRQGELPTVVNAGTIREPKGQPPMSPGVRAAAVWFELAKVIARTAPTEISVEDFTLRGYKANQIPVVRLAGCLDTLRGHRRHPASFYAQEEWQRIVLGRSRQDKGAVGGIMRGSVLGFALLTNDHEIDAAAVAIAHIFTRRTIEAMNRSRPTGWPDVRRGARADGTMGAA